MFFTALFILLIFLKPIFSPLVIFFARFHDAAVILPFGMVRGVGKALSFEGDTVVIGVFPLLAGWGAGKEVAGVNL